MKENPFLDVLKVIAGVLDADCFLTIFGEVAIAGLETCRTGIVDWDFGEFFENYRRSKPPVVIAVNPAEAHPKPRVHEWMDDAFSVTIQVFRSTGGKITGDLNSGRRLEIDKGPSGDLGMIKQVARDLFFI